MKRQGHRSNCSSVTLVAKKQTALVYEDSALQAGRNKMQAVICCM
jgi:hypothetical protein